MPPNNKKQAMLPATAEVIDNPIGTACGFALDIGRGASSSPRRAARAPPHARGADHPEAPGEKRLQTAIHLKRFHSYGSRIPRGRAAHRRRDARADGSVKLGFRAHYPQLETKLTVAAATWTTCGRSWRRWSAKCASASATSSWPRTSRPRGRDPVGAHGATGLAHDRRDVHERTDRGALRPPARRREGLPPGSIACPPEIFAGSVSTAIRRGRAHARDGRSGGAGRAPADRREPSLAVLIDLDDGPDRIDFGGTICLAIATPTAPNPAQSDSGRASGPPGRHGDGLDCLRRHLQGLPVYERIDFEKT